MYEKTNLKASLV